MNTSVYMIGDSDEEIPTQRAIQESLQDRYKIETSDSATEIESFQYTASKEHGQIIAAIRTGQEEALKKLVRHSSAFEEADQQGWLPVHEAAAQLNKNILEITLQASRDITWEQTTLKGETPLLVAVRNCFVDNVHFLLLNGCNPNVKNEEGDSPLVIAIKLDSYDIASLLLRSGARVNLRCVHERTALHEAARLGRKALVQLLLDSGADPDPRSGYGLTPLALAAQMGHTEIMELLLQKGETLLYRSS
ncbi:ankyrin repeat and SOCS box protein 14 isoform X1 [Corvus moneduloides]|uniref:ankyrin repeat and SOCS box protein 14 isoform X1 n=1 Tax=Corvus moneduloides TaxID=1196302 RepID=UPI0013637E6E|nr:ankyrin repeat and SOCS box protein 14 isoform X1 [Corvus moneduloides]